jgi:hypothetical protein
MTTPEELRQAEQIRHAVEDGILTAQGTLLDEGHVQAAVSLWKRFSFLPYPSSHYKER